MDVAARFLTRRRPRWGTLALVLGFHVLVLIGLAQAFAPNLTSETIDRVASIVTVTTREEPPRAPPKPDQGAKAEKGKKAKPKPVSAPKQTLPVKPVELPEVASSGSEDNSGASAAGASTGGGGEGIGTGSGDSGSGQGSGRATKPVLTSGSIEGSAKDFPVPPGGREERIGRSVIIALTVGTDGVPSACRTYRSSGLPATDAATCRLALERLRFRPATNARGEPVVATFYWQQRFFR
jgi:protein TonB